MGCTSAKQLSGVPGGDEAQSNGDVVADQHKVRGDERVEPGGGEDSDGTEKGALLCKGPPGEDSAEPTGNGKILSVHSSHSQQEFFRMLDEKIEKGPDYCSEEEDAT